MRGVRKKDEKQLLEVLTLLQKLESKEILKLIKKNEWQKKQQESSFIPVSLFSATPLSSLEAITVYLRDVKQLRFTEMEKLLNRNQIALSTTYRNARKKYPKIIRIKETKYFIPCSIFSNKKLSVLENIVFYLKHEYNLMNVQISQQLNKDQRTIWTVFDRAKKKVREK